MGRSLFIIATSLAETWLRSRAEAGTWGADKVEHRSCERTYWRISLFLTAASGLVASIAAIFAVFAWRESRHQADISQSAYIAQTRPWVSIEGIALESIGTNNPSGLLQADISLSLKNFGPSTALRSVFYPLLAMEPDNTSTSIRKACAAADNVAKQVGGSIFPTEETATVHYVAQIDPSARVSRAALLHGVIPDVYGCVAYAIPGVEGMHHTTMAGMVWSISPVGVRSPVSFVQQNIPGDHLVFQVLSEESFSD
jgi:hypothetical protein